MSLTRRDVLKGSALAVAGLATAGALASPEPQRRRRLRVGIVGTGGKGWSGMMDAAAHGDIVALCDVDANERARALVEFPHASTFEDYRQMLNVLRGQLDAVIVSTPDHHHAIAAAMAMRRGMHVYCEKPLTRTIWEARQLGNLAREKRVATQMGNQSTASTPMRKVAALIANGTFGKAKEVHLWTDRAGGWWPQGMDRRPEKTPPKPLDFDLWLGPSPKRPFADGYHPFAWRGWWDFGTGALGDMGCHIFNLPFMALNLRDPSAVRAETSGHNRDSFPVWSIVHYEFPATRQRPALELHWYDGGKKPPQTLAPGVTYGGNGVLIVCENATIYSPDESNTTFQILGGAPMPEVDVEESPGHMAEFFRAAMGGRPARANFPDYATPLTETVLLGNLAIWANGPRLEWDARAMRVKGTSEFDSLIRPSYRHGWDLRD